jgi:hypothetical protein
MFVKFLIQIIGFVITVTVTLLIANILNLSSNNYLLLGVAAGWIVGAVIFRSSKK